MASVGTEASTTKRIPVPLVYPSMSNRAPMSRSQCRVNKSVLYSMIMPHFVLISDLI